MSAKKVLARLYLGELIVAALCLAALLQGLLRNRYPLRGIGIYGGLGSMFVGAVAALSLGGEILAFTVEAVRKGEISSAGLPWRLVPLVATICLVGTSMLLFMYLARPGGM